MAKAAEVKVRGYRGLAAGSRRLFGNIDQAADRAFVHTADQVAAMVRGRVPRRTGALAGSVLGEGTDQGARIGMGGGLPYAGWIEYGGTRGRPYVPIGRYLYPTARANTLVLVKAGESAARQEIRRMHWPPPTV